MRSGKLDRTITVRRYDEYAVDDYGVASPTWVNAGTLRAQLVQQTTEEFIANSGADDDAVMIFRTRYLDGVTTKDRIRFECTDYDIREVKITGRNRYMELRCVEHSE